ncbi:RNase adapter RapZ [Neomicrococcus aestuarii]|uniref:RNase adaptor protein RapZ n=1 Tax=Neomicrococcus aestuarii TaxID=556325 RepID=A0A1L2ZME4_9MICC|nr:RNase adapter RapZ [Neomicrococcus aestuarii]APF40192.1 RNase adaptor protein RapZ [Neomicrococcus aestuarii]
MSSERAASDLVTEKPQESELLIVTGLSGAGRTTTSHALEDHGWYVVENLPPQMLVTLADLVARNPHSIPRLAVVVDVRSKHLFDSIRESLNSLTAAGVTYRVLFLEAAENVLVRRFEQGRRPHPLQGSGRISEGIAAERELLQEIRSRADVVLDTTNFNVHDLNREITQLFSDHGPIVLRLNIMSFGFKYGLPNDANFVADVRFVPNPHWVPELRPFTGQDPQVSEFVLEAQGTQQFIEHYVAALEPVLEGYRRENKHYATLAVGCTGGKHRSVAIAEELAHRLSSLPSVKITVAHRDLGRE